MRELRYHHICFLASALLAAVPHCAIAQDATPEPTITPSDQEPSPDPGGLDIQLPGPRLLFVATLGHGHEYRDRLLSDRNIASLTGGVAWKGFAASAVQNWELSTTKTSYEVLLGYSYKLPFADVHAGYVLCGNERMLGGCPDGVRFTLTSNSIRHTTIEASFDQAVGSSRRTFSASVTRDLWRNDETSGAIRAGWTRTDYGASRHLDGISIRLIAERRISNRLSLAFAGGSIWTSGRAQLRDARDGVFANTSLVWRY